MRRLFTNYWLRSTKKGFTLTEVLVAVAILAIAVAAIYTSFKGGLTSWTKGTERMERYQIARVALDMISREISAAIIYTNNEFFYGISNYVNFVAPVREADDVSDLCTIRYYLSNYNGGLYLYRRRQASVDDDIETIGGDAYPLAGPVISTGLVLEYYDGVDAEWQTDWDSQTGGSEQGRLPEAVKITIATWRETTIPYKTQVFSTVVFIPASRGQ